MKLGVKAQYAVTAMAYIAQQESGQCVSLSQISENQGISLPYLEQLFAKLRQAELVKSMRGQNGGYYLVKPAEDIRLIYILEAIGENLKATQCEGEIGKGCSISNTGEKQRCLTHDIWEKLSAHIYKFFYDTYLSEVSSETVNPCPAAPQFVFTTETLDQNIETDKS